jgi:hypothetical protein
MTITAWVNTVANDWCNYILDMLNYQTHVWFGVEQRDERRLCFGNGSNGWLCAPMASTYFGKWAHVAVTRPAGGVGTKLYINGTAVATGNVGADIPGATWWAIGDTPDYVGGRSFQGQIDDLRVYNRVLPGTEVRDVMNNTSGSTADTTAPQVSITSPPAGRIAGSVNITASASDNTGVSKVEIYVDGALKQTFASAPYTYGWNTAQATSGSHTLSAKAYDAAGNVASSAPVSVTVDTTVPTISLTAPVSKATVQKTITVSASASDNVGVAGVQFKLDGVNIGSEKTAAPYSLSWDTTGTSDGSHSLTALARDASGNTATSAAVTVTVSNSTLATPPTTGLVAYWMFDERSGTAAADASGKGNTAVLQNGTGWSTGKIGAGALTMDGMDDRGIISTASFDGAGNMTIAAWINTVMTDWCNYILDMLNYRTHVWFGVEQRGEKRLCFGNGENGLLCAPMDASKFGQWVHVAVTRPAGGTGAMLYINGTAVATGSVGADIPGATWWAIGDTPDFVGGRSFNGQIDDLRVYNRVLAATEIRQLMSTTTSGTADSTAPQVSITAPSNSATISGTVAVTASASDNTGVSKVEIYVDSALKQTFATAPYTYSWNTAQAISGTHTLSAKAYDGAGNSTTSAIVSITVAAVTASDTTPPQVAITSPAPGSTVSGTVVFSANASDNIGIAGVQFKIDGIAIGAEDTTSPFSASWDAAQSAAGSHVVTAVARDAAGNSTTSAGITVTVGAGAVTGGGAIAAGTELINISGPGCANKNTLYLPGNQGRPVAAYDPHNIYVSYLTNETPQRILVVRYDAVTGKCSDPTFVNTTPMNSYNPSHDASSVYVDGNGRVIVTYGGYTQVALGKAYVESAPFMRRATNPNDLTAWGAEKPTNLWNYAETNGVTLKDGTVALVGHDLETRLDVIETNGSHRFNEYMQVVAQNISDSSGSLCGSGLSWNRFTKGILAAGKESAGGQKLYLIWGWTGNENNCADNQSYWNDSHGVYFAYSDDGGRNWKNRAGTKTVSAFQCVGGSYCHDASNVGILHNDEAYRITSLRQKEHRAMWVDESGSIYVALERSNWCDTPITPCYSQSASSPDALVFLRFQLGTGTIAQTTVNGSRHTFIGGIRKDGKTGKLYIWALRNDGTPIEYVSSDNGATWDSGTNIGGPGFTAGRMQGQTDTWWRDAALIALQGSDNGVYLYRRSF